MAPAQQDVHMCGDTAQPQIKMRLKDNNNKSESEVNGGDYPVFQNSDFDISAYEAMEFRPSIRWPDLLVQLALHLVSIYGIYLILSFQVRFYTIFFGKYLFAK